jgi:hypothetical protein
VGTNVPKEHAASIFSVKVKDEEVVRLCGQVARKVASLTSYLMKEAACCSESLVSTTQNTTIRTKRYNFLHFSLPTFLLCAQKEQIVIIVM